MLHISVKRQRGTATLRKGYASKPVFAPRHAVALVPHPLRRGYVQVLPCFSCVRTLKYVKTIVVFLLFLNAECGMWRNGAACGARLESIMRVACGRSPIADSVMVTHPCNHLITYA